MAIWTEIERRGNEVKMADGTPFAVGQQVSMGLGSIELRDTKRAGLHVVRLSGSGHFKYSLKLSRDGRYRLGPDRGHRVIAPSKETDPIKRVLREMDVPVSKLRKMNEGEALPISTFSCDIRRAYPVGTGTSRYLTDGCEETEVTSYRDMRSVNQYCGPEVHRMGQIEGATYAIRVVRRVHLTSLGSHVDEIAVWPDCDPTVLADILAPLVFGSGADAEYVEALRDFEAARRWLAKKFESAPHPNDVERIAMNGCGYLMGSEYLGSPRVLYHLRQRHGERLFEEHLSDRQVFFLRATQSVEEAVQYVLTYYRVVAVRRGDERLLKFAHRSSPDKLGKAGNYFLNGREEGSLKTLLEGHKSLRDTLFVQTTEWVELMSSYPSCRQFRLQDGAWQVNRDWDGKYKHDDFRPVVREEDAIPVRLGEGEFSKQMFCLSGAVRRKGADSERRFHAVMRDGDEAYVDVRNALLLIRVGETRNFVFKIEHALSSADPDGASIWGVTVRRTQAGVEYKPYDNGKLYTCTGGYLGGEVSADTTI